MAWSAGDVVFEFDLDGTDEPVVTVDVITPTGTLKLMGEVVIVGRTAEVRGLHLHGVTSAPGPSAPGGCSGWPMPQWRYWMSIGSILRERVGPRVRIRDVDRVSSGSPIRLKIWIADAEALNVPDAARALARRHLPFAKSHRAFTRMLDGSAVVLLVPMVEDLGALTDELARFGLGSVRHEAPATVDARRVREKIGLTQEDFALRYGLDVATVRNWEQGRSTPDAASRTVLHLIDRDPEAIDALLDSSPEQGPGAVSD